MTRRASLAWMFAFVAVFLVATYAVSQLTLLLPQAFQRGAYAPGLLLGAGYFAVLVISVFMLGRMIYLSELAAGRVKRRVRFFE